MSAAQGTLSRSEVRPVPVLSEADVLELRLILRSILVFGDDDRAMVARGLALVSARTEAGSEVQA